jgi:Cu(I)/Ag(I) efflux system membrane fusion protein
MSANNEGKKWLRLSAAAVSLLLAGLLAGYLMRGGHPAAPAAAPAQAADPVRFWTCSMHPEVKLPQLGKCPKCGMDLVPVRKDAGEEDEGRPRLTLSRAARELAGIQTAPVERRAVEAVLRLTGRVDYDETRLRRIAARYAGRIDKLHAGCCPAEGTYTPRTLRGMPPLPGTFVGNVVEEGAPLADIYSPEMLAAQEELLQAAHLAGADGESRYLPGLAAKTLEAAREKLLLLGLSKDQVAQVERSGKAAEHVTMLAPLAGTITMKAVSEGDYIEVGAEMFTIADLSRVWIMLDAYESDLPLLAVGQEAEFATPALPGEVFKARVAFIDPTIRPDTRTARVRLEAANPDGRLRPGAFGHAVVRRTPAGPGEVLPLVVPATAPLVTGRRAVIYVEVPDAQRPTYEGREVTLGPRAGDWQVVLGGLREGERVVVRGNFKIDSALQIQARPSLMSHGAPAGPAAGAGAADAAAGAPGLQSTCPVMGGKIDRKVFADHEGKRVYFCCPGCIEEFGKDPARYIRQLRDQGVEPEAVPTVPPAGGQR